MSDGDQNKDDLQAVTGEAPGSEGSSGSAAPAPASGEPSVADQAKPATSASETSAIPEEEVTRLTHDIVAAIKTVYDPEIPVDVYELGLIYKIELDDSRDVEVDMTLTAPACPVAGEMPVWVQDAVASVQGVGNVKVNLVFDPPWDMERMSDEAKLALNMF